MLADPSTAPLRSEPREPRDLMIAAANNHTLAFDNISTIKPWLSDCLCRLATGGGFSTRSLYENREEEIFDAVRPVILNGIPEFVTRPDLVSRSIFQYPPPIPERTRQDERVFWPKFEQARPAILGALCDILVTALRREATIDMPSKPRMADFAVWIVAAEPACPWEAGRFLQVYAGNRAQAAEATLEGEPVADLVKVVVGKSTDTPKSWTGTATDLLDELKRITPEAQQRQKDWYTKPRDAATDPAQPISWIQFGGLRFLLSTIRFGGWLLVMPWWVGPVALVLLVASLWSQAPVHLKAAVVTYVVFFCIVGQPMNRGWGLLTAPTFAPAYGFGVFGVKTLWSAAMARGASRARLLAPVGVAGGTGETPCEAECRRDTLNSRRDLDPSRDD